MEFDENGKKKSNKYKISDIDKEYILAVISSKLDSLSRKQVGDLLQTIKRLGERDWRS